MPEALAADRRLKDGDKLAPQVRRITLERKAPVVSPDTRSITFAFSSEEPVDRWWGREVLSHDPGAADFARLNDGAPLLFNHDMDQVLGVVERAWVGDDRRGYATVRFAKTAAAEAVVEMINDGILRNVSFMYDVQRFVATEMDGDGDVDEFTATSWKAYEVSIVSVPADQTVGIGRAGAMEEKIVRVERTKPAAAAAINPLEREAMPKENDGQGGAAVATPTVDVEAVRLEAREIETSRVREIEGMGARFKLKRELVEDWIRSGKSIADVRGLVLEHVTQGGAKPVADFGHAAGLDLTEREKARYSMLRAVNAAMSGDWSDAGFERECSVAIAKANKRDVDGNGATRDAKGRAKAGSFFYPMNLPFCPDAEHARALMALNPGWVRQMQQRAIYQVGTAVQGGNLVETTLFDAQFIEVLRNQLVTAQLGARMLTGLVGNVNIPRQSGQTNTFWVAESGAPTEAEATFDQVQLRPKTIGALSKMSRLMLLQSTPAIEMLARQDLIAVMALGIDLAAISGSGASNQPTGIVNQSGIGSVVGGTNGANFTFDHMIQLYSAPRVANAPQANLGFAINAKTNGYLRTLKSSTGQYLWSAMQGGITGNTFAGDIMGYPYAISNQLRSNLTKGTSSGICSEVVFGNWQELLIGEWGVTEIMVNPYDSTGFTTGDVLIRAFQTIDVGVRHGASFAVMSDGLTPGF